MYVNNTNIKQLQELDVQPIFSVLFGHRFYENNTTSDGDFDKLIFFRFNGIANYWYNKIG